VATIHLFTMVAATVVFALTWVAHLDGYEDGRVTGLAVALGLFGLALLAAGGYLGGALAFVYGVRVLKRPETKVTDALIPGRANGGAHTGAGSGAGVTAANAPRAGNQEDSRRAREDRR
jgi:hypothetical protein